MTFPYHLTLIRSTLQTAGEDDLLTIISFHERRIVARCQGHTSYVTSVAFDDRRKSSARCYRFGSVGEDGRILFVSYAYPHDHWWKELMHHARGSGILIRAKRSNRVSHSTEITSCQPRHHPLPGFT
jgi:hypothetical protein